MMPIFAVLGCGDRGPSTALKKPPRTVSEIPECVAARRSESKACYVWVQCASDEVCVDGNCESIECTPSCRCPPPVQRRGPRYLMCAITVSASHGNPIREDRSTVVELRQCAASQSDQPTELRPSANRGRKQFSCGSVRSY